MLRSSLILRRPATRTRILELLDRRWPLAQQAGHLPQVRGAGGPESQPLLWILCLVVSLGLCLGVTRQSLWIDEATTAWLASHQDPWRLLGTLADGREILSESLMPLFTGYIWTWSRLFGTGEQALRAANIPFAILLVATLGWTSSRLFSRPLLWLVLCFCPFIWFYMNEARPYVAVMACSAVALAAVLAYFADPNGYSNTAPWLFFSALFVGCGFHLFGGLVIPAVIVIVLAEIRTRKHTWAGICRDWRTPLSVSLPLFLLLGGYFIWIVYRGAGGERGQAGPGNLVFAMYEFGGFQGFGPPRNQLRADPTLHALEPYFSLLAAGTIAWLALFALLFRRVLAKWKEDGAWRLAAALLVTIGLFFAGARAVDFRFWGRHLAACLPLFLFALLEAAGRPPQSKRQRAIEAAAFTLLAVAWLVSDYRLAFLPEYGKDDFRSATSIALDEARRSGGTIVWVADGLAGRYYGLEYQRATWDAPWFVRGKAVLGKNWTRAQVAGWLASGAHGSEIILVLSKPDLNDRHGAWAAAIRSMNARRLGSANAFDLFVLRPSPPGESEVGR